MAQATKLEIDRSESLNKLRSLWLARMIHDFRGPLFAARGYSRLISDEKAGPVTATQKDYLRQISENLTKLNTLVDTLSEFPSDEVLHIDLVDLSELISSYIENRREEDATLQVTGHSFTTSVLTIADRDKLACAMHKLLGVAVEFSRSGGEVQIQAKQEDGEFTLRICATRPERDVAQPNAPPGDITMATGILRLHGGGAYIDQTNAGRWYITIRLPIVTPENSHSEGPR